MALNGPATPVLEYLVSRDTKYIPGVVLNGPATPVFEYLVYRDTKYIPGMVLNGQAGQPPLSLNT